MLPNWLLGKSKSKLQEILGGGGTTYTAGEGIDITNHEISVDPLLMNDIEQTALAIPTKAAKTQISNPNILHNPWFSVNQRGFTTDSGSTKWWPADRWYIIGDNKTVTRASDGPLTIKNEANTNLYLVQKGPANKMASLIGKKVTASIMLGDGTIKHGTITFNANERQSYLLESNFELYKNNSSDDNTLLAFTMPAGELTIKALKLEVGEISTLAMDTRPEYPTELLKCQRYFIRVCDGKSDRCIGIGQARSATSALIAISLPIQLISWPQLVISDYTKLTLRNGETYKTGTGAAMDSRSATTQEITIQSTGLTTGACYDAYLASGATLDFDAEL